MSAAPFEDAAVDRAVQAAAELGVPEECVPLTAVDVSERVRSPRFRKGALFRDGATVQPARLARALRRAVLADGVALHERTRLTGLRAGSPSVLETPRGRLRAAEVVLATNAWLTALEARRPAPDELRQLRRAHRARPGPPGGDRLDGRALDLRRAHVPPLLPHDARRPGGDGKRLRAARARRRRRRALLHRLADRRTGRSGAPQAAPRAGRRQGRAGLGRAHRRVVRPPAVLRHAGGDARPLRRGLLRAAVSGQAGSAGRRSPRSSFGPTTSTRPSRSSAAGCRGCRPSRSAGSAAGSCAARSWPARSARRTAAEGRSRPGSWRRCRASPG